MDVITARTARRLLVCTILGALMLRIALVLVLRQTTDADDPTPFFTMARSLVEDGRIIDRFENHFMSVGYPLLLVPFFALFGSEMLVALAVNMLLTAVSMWLVYGLAFALSAKRDASIIAAAIFATWLTGIWYAATIAQENFAIPLTLALALCAIAIARGYQPRLIAMIAGLLWGGLLVTGSSALPLCLGIGGSLIILWRRCGRFMLLFRSALCFLFGAGLLFVAWFNAIDAMAGRPMLSINASFDPNFAELDVLRLIYFWTLGISDAGDIEMSETSSLIHLLDAFQNLLIVGLGLLAFLSKQIVSEGKWVLGVTIITFWLLHATVYVAVRYPDPMMALLIAMAAVPVADWLRQFFARRAVPRA